LKKFSNSINKEIVHNHGLNLKEYDMILNILKRIPNLLELGIFSVMWSEHCSYKSTKKWLKTLPTKAPWVICGPGENAGIIDIGDDDAIVFKMESHNHPSYIEPYQGAATGVGGIMRDVFTMGARPIANLNSLRFGEINNFKTKYLLSGVVSGVGDYGNCVGIPTVGGECFFHECYNSNNLVNAMTVGLVKKNKIFYSIAKGLGYPVFYVGSKTGRDGIHGATMASAEFDEKSKDKRPQVQVGDPFTEKLLLEACLDLMDTDAIIAIQDMGAAGLTSSSFEMASKGDCGIELYLDKVPVRERKMTPYEIMLSETQERMLLIIKPDSIDKTMKIFDKWGLDCKEIGKITDSGYMDIFFNSQLHGRLPIKPLADASPEYDRPSKKKKKVNITKFSKKEINVDSKEALIKIISSPNQSSKEWVFNQYDRSVMGDTILDSQKADAAVVRIHKTNKAVAITCDCNPIYCKSDPYLGSKIAVAETWRNLTSVGAKPLAITDNLNFGNPEKEEIMHEIKESIRGIKDACNALNYPVVSGNVSLYNETLGNSIYPTPVIGGVGILMNYKDVCSINLVEGYDVFLVGKTFGHIELSVFSKEILDKEIGSPPKLDLKEELKNGCFVKEIIDKNFIVGCHDISDGGILLGLAEMVIENKIGIEITISNKKLSDNEWFFSEDQSRYIVISKKHDNLIKLAKKNNVSLEWIGKVKGKSLKIKNSFDISVKELINYNNKWFNNYMS
jgi:phosphoribosylformylglycinamidine synthase subunit PurL